MAGHLPFDVLALQETPEDYPPVIAAALGMEHVFYADGQALIPDTPLMDPVSYLIETRTILHATTTIRGAEFSVYGAHIGWNQGGDVQCRAFVDQLLAVDPAPRILPKLPAARTALWPRTGNIQRDLWPKALSGR